MFSLRIACALLFTAFALPVHAAKVVRLYNAWPDSNITFQMVGGWDGINWNGVDTKGNEVALKGGWYEKVLPTTWTPTSNQNKIRFSSAGWRYNYGAKGYGDQSDIAISDILASSDTVWMIPTPAPNGAPVMTGARPRQITVMLWNPWQDDMTNRTPSVRLENKSWVRMTASVSTSGWYSATLMNFTNLDLLFRNQDSSEYLGNLGVSKLTVPMRLDTVLKRNDSVWVRAGSATLGTPIVTTTPPESKTVLFFNPWDGKVPVVRPLVSIDGSKYFDVPYSRAYCGWYEVTLFNTSSKLLFKASTTSELYGYAGFGSGQPIEVAKVLQSSDTAWVAPTTTTTLRPPHVGTLYSGERGVCQSMLLAATIRDFGEEHPSFEKNGYCVSKGMVKNELGSDRKPVPTGLANTCNDGDSLRLATQFFQDVPGVNATTCRNIPLTLDTTTGLASYTNMSYFPLNDFDTLANGKANPFNSKAKYGNNFHFCLESHGDFSYRKGQTFKFIGDDDVYFFVDGKLVVDIGGIHGPMGGEANLDNMNLVEGKSYNWDFFYCERHITGSSMRMTTSMNLRTQAEFQIADTLRSKGVMSYDIYLSQILGQGCEAARNRVPTSGLFRISGPGLASPIGLNPGVNFGGIRVDSSLGRMVIDSALIKGLAPGRYEIKVMPMGDTTKIKSASFWIDIPMSMPDVRFVAKPSYTGFTGTVLPVTVGAFRNEKADTARALFRVPLVPGLQFYKDSARTKVLIAGDTLWTGSAGKPRQLWVKGLVVGQYTIAVQDTSGKQQDSYGNIAFLNRGIRFTDSAGKPYTTLPSVRANIGDTVTVYLEAYVNDSTCTTCKDTVLLQNSDRALGMLNPSTNKATSQIVLVNGKATLKLTSDIALSNVSVQFQSKDTVGGKAVTTLTPISFEPFKVVYTNAVGNPLPSGWKLDTAIQVPVALGVRIEGVQGVCTKCSGTLKLMLGSSYTVLGPNGKSTDTLAVTKGAAQFTIVGKSATVLDSLRTKAGLRFAASSLGNLRFRVMPPDSAAWYDDDGNGEADRALIHLHHKWTDATNMRLAWPDTSNWLGAASGKLTLSADSMTVTFVPTRQLPGTVRLDSMLGRWNRDETPMQPFAMKDRLAAVPVRAVIAWGTTHDTLRIRTSEPLRPVSKQGKLVEVTTGSSYAPSRQQNAWYDAATGDLVVVYPAGDTANAPAIGDSVRFGQEVSDLLGNLPGDKRKAVVVTGSDPLPRDAMMLDSDADGRADRVVLRLTRPLSMTKSYRFYWPNRDGVLESRDVVVKDGVFDSLGLRLTFDLPEPFAFGATQCPVRGCKELGESFTNEGSSGRFTVRDGVDPIILKAHLLYADSTQKPDTLQLTYSEPVTTVQGSKIWASWGLPSESPLGAPIPSLEGKLDSSSTVAKLPIVIDESFPFKVGDSVRITRQKDGNTRDLQGNAPDSMAVWTVVTEGLRPPQLKLELLPPVQKLPTRATSDKQKVEVFIYNPQTGRWTDIHGQPVDTTGYMGINLLFTGTIHGFAYFYDNMGVSVISKDIGILAQLSEQKRIPLDVKGQSRVMIGWNGVRPDGQLVAPGVYIARVVGKLENTTRHGYFNHILKFGWKR